MFKCNLCNKEFTQKQKLTYHLNKKVCDKKESCEICGKKFNSKSGIYKHQKREHKTIITNNTTFDQSNSQIKTNLSGDEHVKKDIKILKQKNKQLLCKISDIENSRQKTEKKLLEEINNLKTLVQNGQIEQLFNNQKIDSNNINVYNCDNVQNIQNIQNIQNNIQQNITITPTIILKAHGSEDYSKIELKKLAECLNRGFGSINELIECVNFNPNLPENHNIYISNSKNYDVHRFNGNKWIIEDRDDGLEFIINKKIEKIQELKQTKGIKEKINPKSCRILNELSFLDDEKNQEIYKKLKRFLNNNKDIPMETRKKIAIQNKIS